MNKNRENNAVRTAPQAQKPADVNTQNRPQGAPPQAAKTGEKPGAPPQKRS